MNVIAPGISDTDYFDGKRTAFEVFESRIRGWILTPAQILAGQGDESGLAILMLSASVFEPLGGVLPLQKNCSRNSEGNFCNGFVRVFPEVQGSDDVWKVASIACNLLRHGLFHEGFIKHGLAIEALDVPILVQDGWLHVNPRLFIERILRAFEEFRAEYTNSPEGCPLRLQFEEYWKGKQLNERKRIEAAGLVDFNTTGTSTLAAAPVTFLSSANGTVRRSE